MSDVSIERGVFLTDDQFQSIGSLLAASAASYGLLSSAYENGGGSPEVVKEMQDVAMAVLDLVDGFQDERMYPRGYRTEFTMEDPDV